MKADCLGERLDKKAHLLLAARTLAGAHAETVKEQTRQHQCQRPDDGNRLTMPARNPGPTDDTRNMAATPADQNQPLKTTTARADEDLRAPQSPSPTRAATGERTRTTGAHWVESLHRSDVTRLWTELHRVVCSHPLVRASYSAGLLVEGGERGNAYVDLTQELFVTLLSKGRFQHYLDTQMSDAEIECEIGQIELTNLLTAELRKRHPESYRLARRISTIIQSSPNFRRFDSNRRSGASPAGGSRLWSQRNGPM